MLRTAHLPMINNAGPAATNFSRHKSSHKREQMVQPEILAYSIGLLFGYFPVFTAADGCEMACRFSCPLLCTQSKCNTELWRCCCGGSNRLFWPYESAGHRYWWLSRKVQSLGPASEVQIRFWQETHSSNNGSGSPGRGNTMGVRRRLDWLSRARHSWASCRRASQPGPGLAPF